MSSLRVAYFLYRLPSKCISSAVQNVYLHIPAVTDIVGNCRLIQIGRRKFNRIHNRPHSSLYLHDSSLNAYALRTEVHRVETRQDHTHTAVSHKMHVSWAECATCVPENCCKSLVHLALSEDL